MDGKCLVSVIIPTYKRSSNLKRAIDSVLVQTYTNIEIIVVDDNGYESYFRNETEAVMDEYIDLENVIYIQHITNLNGAAARNTGLIAASGQYIAFLDDDDEWLVDKLDKQMDFLLSNHQFKGCYSRSAKYINNLKYYETKYNEVGNLTFDLLSLRSEIYTPSLLFCKSSIDQISGFNESFIRHQDYDLLLRFFKVAYLGCVDSVLVKVHVDDESSRPDFYNFKKNKKHFLSVFGEDIKALPDQADSIYREHYFELSYYAIKSKKFSYFLYYLIKSKPSLPFIKSKLSRLLSILKRNYFKV